VDEEKGREMREVPGG